MRCSTSGSIPDIFIIDTCSNVDYAVAKVMSIAARENLVPNPDEEQKDDYPENRSNFGGTLENEKMPLVAMPTGILIAPSVA